MELQQAHIFRGCRTRIGWRFSQVTTGALQKHGSLLECVRPPFALVCQRRHLELQMFVARPIREFHFSEVEDKPVKLCRPGLLIQTAVEEDQKGP